MARGAEEWAREEGEVVGVTVEVAWGEGELAGVTVAAVERRLWQVSWISTLQYYYKICKP